MHLSIFWAICWNLNSNTYKNIVFLIIKIWTLTIKKHQKFSFFSHKVIFQRINVEVPKLGDEVLIFGNVFGIVEGTTIQQVMQYQ